MVKRYHFCFRICTHLAINTIILTMLQPPLPATPLDDFLSTFSDSQIRSVDDITLSSNPTPHLTRALETLTAELHTNLQTIDPHIFTSTLKTLAQHIQLSVLANDNIDSILTTILKHFNIDPSENNKNYLFLNITYAYTDFLNTTSPNQPLDVQALNNHLMQSLTQTIHTIQGAPKEQKKEKKRFFKKRYMLLLLFLISLSIALSIALYVKIKGWQRQAEQEKMRQRNQELEKIKQELTCLCHQKIDENQKAIDAETSQLKSLINTLTDKLTALQQECDTKIDKLVTTHTTHQQANTTQIEELVQTLEALDQKCATLAKDYEGAKTLIETQKATYTKAIDAAQASLKRLLRSFNTTMGDIDHRLDEVTTLDAQEKKGGKTWIDTATEEVNLDRFSKAIDVATKGMGAAAVAYGLYQQTRSDDRETVDTSSLSARLAKLRGDTSLSWPKIPTTLPKL